MIREPVTIKEIQKNDSIEIVLIVKDVNVAAPLLFIRNESISMDDFFLEVLLLLSFVAARYENKYFEKVVSDFAKYVKGKYLVNLFE